MSPTLQQAVNRVRTAFVRTLVGLAVVAGAARADFNDIITGARPAAMGGAFVAIADDINATYWNPAGLTLKDDMELGFMSSTEIEPTGGSKIGTDFLGWSSGNSPYGAAGVSFLRQGLSTIYQERTLALSYGYALTPFTRVGLNLKTLSTVLNPVGRFAPDPALQDTSSLAFDVSGMQIVSPQLRFGFLARNLGARNGTVERDDTRRTYRLGVAYNIPLEFFGEDNLWLSFDMFTKEDIEDRSGVKIRNALGVEWNVSPWLSVRGGSDRGRLTAGVGLQAYGLKIDYAFAEDQDDGLGTQQRLSMTYRFGGAIVTERHETVARERPLPALQAGPRVQEAPPPSREPPLRERVRRKIEG